MTTFLDRQGNKYSVPQTEAQWQAVVVKVATDNGWEWMHIGRTGKYSPNGAKGTLGIGWPDLLLTSNRGMLFVELKLDGEDLSAAQRHVRSCLLYAGADYHVWRPSDFALMMHTLVG